MNIMLLIVAVASFVVGQIPTGIFVVGLVTFNVVMGSAQELKARASVEALAQLQVAHARVRRDGEVQEAESTQLVPGDIALLEAGDVVPADGLALVAFTAVNLGFVMRREREAPWSSPLFPFMGWIILGWFLAWAGVELPMLQRLLDTESLSGSQWAIVLGVSLIAPALVWADKAIQLRRQNTAASQHA
jgi:magnesium-transporting ATPase (P-type)